MILAKYKIEKCLTEIDLDNMIISATNLSWKMKFWYYSKNEEKEIQREVKIVRRKEIILYCIKY